MVTDEMMGAYRKAFRETQNRLWSMGGHIDNECIRDGIEAAIAAMPKAKSDTGNTADDDTYDLVSGPAWEIARLRDNRANDATARRMIREAVEEFGPTASLESEDAVLLRGPEPVHEAEAIIEALARVRVAHAATVEEEQVAHIIIRMQMEVRAAAAVEAARAEEREAWLDLLDALHSEGKITDEGLAAIRARMSDYDADGKIAWDEAARRDIAYAVAARNQLPEVLAALDAAEAEARETVAKWMIAHSFATGHGDTIGDLLDEFSWQVKEQRDRFYAAEAEVARLREVLAALEAALRKDSRGKTVFADTVEYHLDGQAMYQAINLARAALAPKEEGGG